MKYEYKIDGVVWRITSQLITKHIEYSFKSIANYRQLLFEEKQIDGLCFDGVESEKNRVEGGKRLEFSLSRRFILI